MTVDTDEFSSEQIDAGAEALRQYEQAGKRLNSWESLPTGTKRKWREKSKIVLFAATSGRLALAAAQAEAQNKGK